MEKTTLLQFKKNFVDNNFEGVSFYQCLVVQWRDEVSYGFQKDVNFEYCEANDIPTIDLKRDGGCIVHFKNNVAWAEIRPNNVKGFEYTNILFLRAFCKYLKDKGLNAVLDNNDILIDNYKVASGCAINLKPDYLRTFSAVQISYNCDVEMIENICTKPMTKTPKGLSEYGLTKQEIIDFVENYFAN